MRRWMGSVHDAVQIWICVRRSSRLMARVGPDKCSICRWDVLRFNPELPVVHVGSEFGATVQQAVVSETMNREIGSTAAANPHGERRHPWSMPLLDVRVGTVMMHAVCGGARAPS